MGVGQLLDRRRGSRDRRTGRDRRDGISRTVTLERRAGFDRRAHLSDRRRSRVHVASLPLPIFSDVDLSRAVKRWTVRAFSGLASLLLSAWMEWRYPGVIGRWVDTATSSFWSFVSAPAPLGVVILLFALLIALVVGRHC